MPQKIKCVPHSTPFGWRCKVILYRMEKMRILAIVAGGALLLALVVLSFTFVQVRNQQVALSSDLAYRTNILSDSLAEAIEPALARRDTVASVQKTVDRISANERVAGFAVYDSSPKLLAFSALYQNNPPVSLADIETVMQTNSVKNFYVGTGKTQVYVSIAPLHSSERITGALVLMQHAGYIATAVTDAWIRNLVRFLLQLVIFCGVILILIRFVFQKSIRELAELIRVTRRGTRRPLETSGLLKPIHKEISSLVTRAHNAYLNDPTIEKPPKAPLKKFTIGFEVEFFVIDTEGRIVPGADKILAKIAEKTKFHEVTKECAHNLIELGSYPNIEGTDTMKSLLAGLKLLVESASEAGYGILPLGTYPGKFTPEMRSDPRYRVQTKLFGKTRFQIAGRVAGYHCHYALPWGVFDSQKLTLKELSISKNQEYLVNAFNFLIAADPALTTFMQSSPFYQGRHFAKDTRMLVYRGSEELEYPRGLYNSLPTFGSLPAYVHAGADLLSRIRDRNDSWLKSLADIGVKGASFYRSILDTNWTPVKINAHGTFEQRGMDMNRLPVLLSVSLLLQIILRHIQDGNLKVVPHDSAKAEPFAFDKHAKTIRIAPDTHVRKYLQHAAAHEGLENDDIHYYCRRLLSLAKILGGKELDELLRPLTDMLAGRRTTADDILSQARSLGYKDMRKLLPQNIASEIALTHARQMSEDIVSLEKMIEGYEKLTS